MEGRTFATKIGEIRMEAAVDDTGAFVNVYLDGDIVGHATVDIGELLGDDPDRRIFYGYGDGAGYVSAGHQFANVWISEFLDDEIEGWDRKEERAYDSTQV